MQLEADWRREVGLAVMPDEKAVSLQFVAERRILARRMYLADVCHSDGTPI